MAVLRAGATTLSLLGNDSGGKKGAVAMPLFYL